MEGGEVAADSDDLGDVSPPREVHVRRALVHVAVDSCGVRDAVDTGVLFLDRTHRLSTRPLSSQATFDGMAAIVRIVTLNADDITGGAARAAHGLHESLKQRGHEVSMLVARRRSSDPTVKAVERSRSGWQHRAERALRKLGWDRRLQVQTADWVEAFSGCRSEHRSLARQLPPHDVLHLHWVSGFVDLPTFFDDLEPTTPVVWTLHDMNLLTGGCHYDMGCGRFRIDCGRCPQLNSAREGDASRQILRTKRDVLRRLNPDRLRIVCPSRWLAEEAGRSPVLGGRFRIDVIANSVDPSVFRPLEPDAARAILDIPTNARVILFVAHDPRMLRKGFHVLCESLASFESSDDLLLLSLGKATPAIGSDIEHRHLGFVESDHLLALAYNAADLFMIPSLQDNLPTTVLESMACSTPVLGFDVGGISDMVRPGVSGRVVPAGDVAELATAAAEMLADPEELRQLGRKARALALDEYSPDRQAFHFETLYSELIERSTTDVPGRVSSRFGDKSPGA